MIAGSVGVATLILCNLLWSIFSPPLAMRLGPDYLFEDNPTGGIFEMPAALVVADTIAVVAIFFCGSCVASRLAKTDNFRLGASVGFIGVALGALYMLLEGGNVDYRFSILLLVFASLGTLLGARFGDNRAK